MIIDLLLKPIKTEHRDDAATTLFYKRHKLKRHSWILQTNKAIIYKSVQQTEEKTDDVPTRVFLKILSADQLNQTNCGCFYSCCGRSL